MGLRILNVPSEFRPAPGAYPLHQKGPNLEQAATELLIRKRSEIRTSGIFIPVHWQNLYFVDHARRRLKDYGPVPGLQKWIDDNVKPSLGPYFTISQADEGIYEKFPCPVYLFNAGGVGDEPIPLLSSPHAVRTMPKTTLACFVGCIETGGPVALPEGQKPLRSSWDPNGAGAKVRRAMRDALDGLPGFYFVDQRARKAPAIRQFEHLMMSSHFALCPRGYGRTSFRLYEAIQMGVIPVYIHDEAGPWLPYSDKIEWSKFCIVIDYRHLDRLPSMLNNISEPQRAAMRGYMKQLYEPYFTMEGAAQQIRNRLSVLWPE